MVSKFKVSKTFTILNKEGLHGRPATALMRRACKFQSQIYLIYKDSKVNAKSSLDILTLAAECDTKICVEAEGQDAQEAVNAIIHLANNNFDIHY